MSKIIMERIEREAGERRTRGLGYYRDLCFHVHATHPSGERIELVDGGVMDWTQRLLGNAKERLITSGLGSQRLCSEFCEF